MSQRFTKDNVFAALKKATAAVTLFSIALSFAGCAKKENGTKFGKINIP